jgi:hypothetical protein
MTETTAGGGGEAFFSPLQAGKRKAAATIMPAPKNPIGHVGLLRRLCFIGIREIPLSKRLMFPLKKCYQPLKCYAIVFLSFSLAAFLKIYLFRRGNFILVDFHPERRYIFFRYLKVKEHRRDEQRTMSNPVFLTETEGVK